MPTMAAWMRARLLGEAYQQVFAFRCRSRTTQHRLAAGEMLGPETSIDKILVATAEQTLFDAVRDLLPGVVEFDDSPEAEVWRMEHLYSRAATIYGGTPRSSATSSPGDSSIWGRRHDRRRRPRAARQELRGGDGAVDGPC